MKNNNGGIRKTKQWLLVMFAATAVLLSGLSSAQAVNVRAAEAQQEALSETDMAEVQEAETYSAYKTDMVRSRGKIQYGQAVIDGQDLQNISAHMSEKKNAVSNILVQLGTKFRLQSGEYTYDRAPDSGQESIDMTGIGWSMLFQAVSDSQSVPGGLPVLNPGLAMHIEGVEERTDYYGTAIEDNISRGKAAWADGKLLLGNGADNDKAYEQGHKDGEEHKPPKDLYPIYGVNECAVEIVHEHIGLPEKEDGISGCYENSHTTSVQEHTCGAQLYQTENTFYPNENEPGGGTWHGGYYTCASHGGVYDSPGICKHKSKKTVTTWKHDIICGLTDVVYARLTVRGTDTDYSDRALRLEAVLEQGEGYEHFAWQEGDELVWTDEAGDALGIGPELMIYEPGTYQCSINVANADINNKTASVNVSVIGLVQQD